MLLSGERISLTPPSMIIDDDIDEIIRNGEDKTKELNSKYAGLDLDALNNFKSESLVNTWEGEEFGPKVSHRWPFLLCINPGPSEKAWYGSSRPNESVKAITRSTNTTATT